MKGEKERTAAFPIVGVGASAGGMEAFRRLLSRLPANTGMGIVFIQHLNPTHASQLSEILSKSTEMPVVEAEDGMAARPNHVYIIPPNADLAILHGVLHLMPLPGGGPRHMAIDYFFRSLAQDQGSRAIGVVLSGSNSDGALGLQAIKAEGGITLVQDESSAQYSTMPRSAINAGAVDFVLPPEEIAAELARVGQHPYTSEAESSTAELVATKDASDLDKIFILLRTKTGADFTHYKHATIRRRIMRRMALLKTARLGHYAKYLQDNPAELSALYDDLLINVTSFFRDPETFEAIKAKVFPKVMATRQPDIPVRIWVAGCATGEETYSIAISLLEYLGDEADTTQIQVFGTDISEKAIEKARIAVYPENISLDVSPGRLKRFFSRVETGYQISKTIRDMCVFSRQNLVKDPPFSRLDLISCRNLLIYMDAALQRKIIPIFHYALNHRGFLILGSAETVGGYSDLFSVEDRKYKIHSKNLAEPRPNLRFSIPAFHTEREEPVPVLLGDEAGRKVNLQKEYERIILNRYGPPGVVIDHKLEIVLFRGHTGLFLEPAPGEASLNIVSMAREGLMPELRSAIFEARNRNLPARRDGLRVKSDDKLKNVSVQVHPIGGLSPKGDYYLVLFEDVGYLEGSEAGKRREKQGNLRRPSDQKSRQIEGLNEERTATKEYLESVVAQHQATNEELRSANEEIQSSNEELQSINEELETAKEELQATNEELTTVNDELQTRNIELGQTNDDLLNLLSNIAVPVIMLDRDLCIRRFTPTAEKVLHLIPTDVGRSIHDLKLNINVPSLFRLTSEVIDSLVPREIEVQDQEAGWYSLRIRPYKTAENRIGGAVLVWVDISGVKHSGVAQDSLALIRAVADTVTSPVVVLDEDLRIKLGNNAFYVHSNLSREQVLDLPVDQLGRPPFDLPTVQKFLAETSSRREDSPGITVEYQSQDGGTTRATIRAREVDHGGGKLILMALQSNTAASG